MRQFLQLLIVAALCSTISGCFAPLVVAGAQQGVTASKRGGFEALANAGDPEAQYNLGMTYCCQSGTAIERTVSVYDNQKASQWLCKSAVQDYGPAQYQLALMFAGATDKGSSLGSRHALVGVAANRIADHHSAPAVAWVWTSLAANNSVDGAATLRDEVDNHMPQEEMDWAVNQLNTDWHQTPCIWNDVMGIDKK
jgi:hypothetical protein